MNILSAEDKAVCREDVQARPRTLSTRTHGLDSQLCSGGKGGVQYVGLPRSTGRREQLPKHPFLATEATPESGNMRQGLVWLGQPLWVPRPAEQTHVWALPGTGGCWA